jgi:hypothetical protein
MPLNAGMASSPAHDPVRATMASPSSAAVSSPARSASAIATMISSVCPGVRNGCRIPARGGIAPRAAVQRGRSSAGSRCTVPRGPYVLTRLRSSQRLRRTSAWEIASERIPTDNSAAAKTWARAPRTWPSRHRPGGRARRARQARSAPAAGYKPLPTKRHGPLAGCSSLQCPFYSYPAQWMMPTRHPRP